MTFIEDVLEYMEALLCDERQGPLEDIHIVWQNEGMLVIIILLGSNFSVLEEKYGALVVINVAVVWCGKDSYYWREFLIAVPLVELVPLHLNFMGTYYTKEVVVF